MLTKEAKESPVNKANIAAQMIVSFQYCNYREALDIEHAFVRTDYLPLTIQ